MQFSWLIQSLLIFFIITMTSLLSQDKKNRGLEVGDPVPYFEAIDQNGEVWRLQDHLDKQFLVIYFYPAAMTGGCTKQACGFRDARNTLDTLDVNVIGISGDEVDNLKLFAQQNQLNFTLLSDQQRTIADQFGVNSSDGGTITRLINGKEFILRRTYTPNRWTFVINSNRQIVYKNTAVNATNDASEVIAAIKKLKSD